MREYQYLAIDSNGAAWECKNEPLYLDELEDDFLNSDMGDESIRRAFTFNEADYEKVFRADMKHKTQSLF